MNIQEQKVFAFSFPVDGAMFNFSITADTKDEAIKKLSKSLAAIQEELKQAKNSVQ